MSQHLRDFVQALYGFDAVVGRLDARDLDRATPCERWNVRRLLSHNGAACWMTAEMARGRPATISGRDAPDGTPAILEGQVWRPDLFTTYNTEPFLKGGVADAARAWSVRRADVLEALDQKGALRQETRSPWGHPTVDEWLGFLVYDTVVHTWDLARSADQPVVIEAPLAQRALAALAAMSELYDVRIPISLAPARPVGPNRGEVDELIAFAGRDPDWRPPATDRQGRDGNAATRS